MYNHLLYFAYWVVNSLVLYFANVFLPDAVTLGDWRFNAIESSIYAGFWVTFVTWAFWDFAIARQFNLQNWFVDLGYFWLANFFALWAVSLFSRFTGFSMVGYEWILATSFVATIFQRMVWSFFVPRR
jgi:hypothetical protein